METEGGVAEGEERGDVPEDVGEAVALPGPTRKKFPATGFPNVVLVAKLVRLKFVLKDVSVALLVVPLKNASAEVLKLPGWR